MNLATTDALSRFLQSPIARKVEADLAADVARERAAAAAELRKVAAEQAQAQRDFDRRLKPINVEIEKAREQIRDLEAKAFELLSEMSFLQNNLSGRDNSARRVLTITANPSIAQTVRDLRRHAEDVRESFAFQEGVDTTLFEPQRVVRSNGAKIEAVVTDIRSAIDELEALTLSAADCLPTVERIRKTFRLASLAEHGGA